MSDAEARAAIVVHWLAKADQAIAAARREFTAGDFSLAINRVYYACFYAASAVLLSERKTFIKHTGVRSAVHQHFVRPGRIVRELGEFYDRAFDDRMEMDYQVVAAPEPDEFLRQISGAEQFVAEMRRLLASPGAS